MKKLLLFLNSLAIFSASLSQSVEWREGVVVLPNDEVLTGSIHYPKGFDLIVLQTNNEKTVLTANKVQLFRYYDPASDINRKFISIRKNRWSSQFYEVVVNGGVSVLRELRRYADKAHPDEIESYDYFTWTKGVLEPMKHFRNRVFPKLLAENPEMKAYVHREGLDPNEMKSAFQIIMEFNRLRQDGLLARID